MRLLMRTIQKSLHGDFPNTFVYLPMNFIESEKKNKK